MTLTQLRALVAVADSGSVRAAAEQLVVSQPAVSAALRALRESLGIELVEPEGRGIRLTAAGERLAAYGRQVLGLLTEAELAVASEASPSQGTVRIAAVTTASEHVLPRFLAHFVDRYPDVRVVLSVDTREVVWSLLESHEVDVVLAGRPPTGSPVRVRALRPNELVVIAPPGPRPTSGAVPLEALEDRTWLLREEGSGTRETLEAMLTTAELEPATLTLGSNGAVIAGVVAGLGLTLMSRQAVERELDAGELEVLAVVGTPLQRPWHVATQARPTATTELFVDDLIRPRPSGPGPAFTPAG